MKNIFDCKHVKHVKAVALLKNGEMVGRIVANWSDNPAGSVCAAQVMLWDWEVKKKRTVMLMDKPTELSAIMIGRAGGYGYDKFSSAVYQALKAGGLEKDIPVEPGAGSTRETFEEAGYTWVEVI